MDDDVVGAVEHVLFSAYFGTSKVGGVEGESA
jgi:hypothetical protein